MRMKAFKFVSAPAVGWMALCAFLSGWGMEVNRFGNDEHWHKDLIVRKRAGAFYSLNALVVQVLIAPARAWLWFWAKVLDIHISVRDD